MIASNRLRYLPLLLLAAACACSSQSIKTAKPTPPKDTRDAALTRQAMAIVDAFTNSEPVFTRDGKSVVFVSSRDGLPQFYIADAARPDVPARRLLRWPERMSGALPTPDGEGLIFSSDTGANERWSIYRVGLDGEGVVALTPDEDLNLDAPFLPDGTPDTLFYSARALDAPASSVYTTSARAPGGPRRIYQDAQAGFLRDVSRDGSAGLFLRFLSIAESQLLLLDLLSGTARVLYPLSGKAAIFDVAFSADGKRVFVATDGGTEQTLLLAFDARTGEEVGRFTGVHPATAQIEDVTVAKQGDTLALTLNAGNKSEILLVDARSLLLRAHVKMPLGHGYAGEFSEDGSRLTATWSTPFLPEDIFVIDAKTGEASQLRREARPSLAELPGIESEITEITSFDGLKLPTNIYLPTDAADKKLPVIVNFHGGPAGSSVVGWSPLARFFLAQGYAWVEPNIRGSAGFGRAFEAADNGRQRLASFADLDAVARWTAGQPWADKDRLIILGSSFGGYLVLIALTRQPDLWQAGVDLYGLADLETFMSTTTGLVRQNYLVELGDPVKDAEFLHSISPLNSAEVIVDPLFVYAGANDPRVPRSQSDLIVEALRRRKVPVEYMVKDNEGHSLARRENRVEFYVRLAQFLEAHIK